MTKKLYQYRKLVFFAALSIEIVTVLAFRQGNMFFEPLFLALLPIAFLLVLRPFNFLKESVEVVDTRLIYRVRKRVAKMILFSEIEKIEGRSIFGMIPVLTVTSKNEQMDIPLRITGATDLYSTLIKGYHPSKELDHFFSYYSALIREDFEVDRIMTFWMEWYFLFALITPLLIWELTLGHTVIWMITSLFTPFVLSPLLKMLNRIALSLSEEWSGKNLTLARHWIVVLVFAAYLIRGIRFIAA